MKKLKRLKEKIKLHLYAGDSWDYYVTYLGLESPKRVVVTKNKIFLKGLGLEVEREKFLFLLKGYDSAMVLVTIGAIFRIEEERLMITLKKEGLTFEIQTQEELFILKEIFVEGVYNFKTPHSMQEYVLIDIGMNVAFASSYFAKVKKVPHIISFEPFTPTYQQAQKHINLNDLSAIIEARNVGIGGEDEEIEVEYSPDYRGQVGIQGTDFIRSTLHHTQKEKITLLDASPVLEEIALKFPNKRFIFKIDCEGAEYALYGRIPTSIMEKTDIVMMEWHEKGADALESWLNASGFSLFSFYPHSQRAGMIYAIRV